MKNWLKKNAAVLSIVVVSLLTHFIWYGWPPRVVFDEVHFGKFSSAYLSGKNFFDNHPPAGKLIIALGAQIGGYSENFSFEKINQPYTGNWYLWFRIFPTLFGTLIPVLAWLVSRKLGASEISAWLAGMLLALESGFIVESRFALLNSFLIGFGLLGVLLWIIARKRRDYGIHIVAAIFLGLAGSIKWTGFAFWGVIVLAELIDLIRKKINWRKWIYSGLVYTIVPFLIYIFFFAVHFALLTKPGYGDYYFKPGFQNRSFVSKTIELNYEMANTQKRIGRHPYESPWYTWPTMKRSVYYWAGERSPNGDQAKIYYLGNPAVYALAALGVASCAAYIVINRKDRKKRWSMIFVVFGYLANYLPFMFITRAMFLYHYMSALVFGVLAWSLILSTLPKKHQVYIVSALAFITLIFFVYFMPITYGLQISDSAFRARMWLASWI